MIKSSIFKSYDIRGIYPDQLNEATTFEVGRGFVKHTNTKKIVVGYDARLSSPELFRSLAEGITSQGVDVYFIGMVPTECLYFATGNYDFDAGIIITASHNPKEYNGFKMVAKRGQHVEIIKGVDLLSTISTIEKNDYEEKTKGKIYEKDIWQEYMAHMLSFIDVKKVKPFKVVIDASNGVIGKVIDKFENKLPVKITKLNFEPNGNFPNHSPNPLEEGSVDQISDEVRRQKADLGFIFDGDADRVYLITEKGDFVKADITLILLAKYFLKKNPGAYIAHHVTCSKAVPEFIKKWGGKPIRTKVGFFYIQQGLIKNKGIMGGELSGHYCFKDNFYCDSGMIAFLTLLQIISEDARNVSSIMKELSPYVKDPEINFEVENKDEIIEKVKEKYSNGKQDFLDGVTVEYKNWWFNVRPSNTEPLLRLTIEAETRDMLELKKKELSDLINSFKN